MPRQPREKSKTGVYHIMLRGIDGRNIFLDIEDKVTFIDILSKVKDNVSFSLYGYCIMDNHVHLLMNETEEIGTTIKRLAVAYAHWHNSKYGRTGHLFQNRFRSEVVETDGYFKVVLRYIHNNPAKARLVKDVGEYKWSSYNDYLVSYQNQKTLVDTEVMKGYFTNQEEFIHFTNLNNNDDCLDYEEQKRYRDEGLRSLLVNQYGVTIEELGKLPTDLRNENIKRIYEGTGTSIRQLSRVTGMSKKVVELAIKGDK